MQTQTDNSAVSVEDTPVPSIDAIANEMPSDQSMLPIQVSVMTDVIMGFVDDAIEHSRTGRSSEALTALHSAKRGLVELSELVADNLDDTESELDECNSELLEDDLTC